MHRQLLRVALAGGACSGSALAQDAEPQAAESHDHFSNPLRLLDLSLNTLVNVGGSTEQDDEIEQLQGGGHDPRQRGFTLSQVELSALGAVDPYFELESHLVWFIDPDGESQFELEEAFGRTSSLPHGLELKVGHYFTDFGRINAQHAHEWDFLDQPVIASRLFGEDGMRGTGAQLAWSAPLPWSAQLGLGLQNAEGETMASFGGGDDDLPGGHVDAENDTSSLADFAWSTRLLQSFELGDEWVSRVGVSGAWGPSAAGSSTRAAVYGADLEVKWQRKRADHGESWLLFQAEAMRRIYGTSLQSIDPDGVPASGDDATVPGDTLHDLGGYLQALWGFTHDWAVGLRWERARSSGDGLVPAEDDAKRDDRQRFSPLLVWKPSHFSRIRLQTNLDYADHLEHGRAWSVWLGFEFVVGSHADHAH
jgi:hypothetical protein